MLSGFGGLPAAVDFENEEMRSYNLFISHSWKYEDDYQRLVALLQNRGYFQFRNYSVESDVPKNNWSEIERNIKWASVLVVIAGVYASYSPSIKREIMLAGQYGKPTLAIVPWGNRRATDLRNQCDLVVRWNTESIVSAIRSLA